MNKFNMSTSSASFPTREQSHITYETQDLATWFAGQKAEEEVREALKAAKLATVRASPAPAVSLTKAQRSLPTPAPEIDFGSVNWIGKLIEYHQARPGLNPPLCVEDEARVLDVRNGCFVCTVTLAEAPESPFGTTLSTFGFSNKKDAKKYACKLAVEWLVASGHMPSVDQVSFNKAGSSSSSFNPGPKTSFLGATKTRGSSDNSPTGDRASYSKQVRDLAEELGFIPPMYQIDQNRESTSFYSGYAHFGNDYRLEGRLGVFSHVYGRKNAKEQCAKELYEFLSLIKKERLQSLDTGELHARMKRDDDMSILSGTMGGSNRCTVEEFFDAEE